MCDFIPESGLHEEEVKTDRIPTSFSREGNGGGVSLKAMGTIKQERKAWQESMTGRFS